MILIGQFDSPFVRRVGIALRLYEFPFEHLPWSTFGDAEKIAVYNPLRRVPTLVLDSGEVLIESNAILDYLDERAGEDLGLIPASGSLRRAALRICGLATGLCDKAVSLVYERVLHEATSQPWIERCTTQINGVLDILEAEKAKLGPQFWFGTTPGHSDISVACALRFLSEAYPGLFELARWPNLSRHSAISEEMPPFREIAQEFIPPK